MHPGVKELVEEMEMRSRVERRARRCKNERKEERTDWKR